jgi:hypothetical protein
MDTEVTTLLKQASLQAIEAIREPVPELSALHQARSVRFSIEALRRMANDDRGNGSFEPVR